ncbi:MAG TPA: ferritin-like domain-containing protein [Acidimicrobiales bacterium]|nr:ferritin-like domain-containing protein [Acidimicrobiales bacterium]
MSTTAPTPTTDAEGGPAHPVAPAHAHPTAAEPVPDRRRFFRSLAVGGAAVAAGAVAGPLVADTAASAQTTTTASIPPTIPAGDVRLVNFAIGLELAASQIYVDMSNTGKMSGVPLNYARSWVSHHSDHATALATVAADQATTTANATLLARLGALVNAATTAEQLYRIAFDMESSMAATHQQLMATLANWQGAATVATLEPIEAQHAVVWGQLLDLPTGQWMPAFQSVSGAYDLATYAAS